MLFESVTGHIHFIASITALLSGTFVLSVKKGTQNHIRAGYLYTASMVIVLITAFMIYRLFGGWGMFHWAAVISTATLAAGMIPIWIKKPAQLYISLHFSFMYWSIMGLYGAFFAETFVRLPSLVVIDGVPNSAFYNMVGISVFFTMAIGGWFFYRNLPKWKMEFIKPENPE